MTTNEQNKIIDALHQMELRFTDRLTRVEEQMKMWQLAEQDIRRCLTKQEDRMTIVTLWLLAVTFIAIGDGVLRMLPLL